MKALGSQQRSNRLLSDEDSLQSKKTSLKLQTHRKFKFPVCVRRSLGVGWTITGISSLIEFIVYP